MNTTRWRVRTQVIGTAYALGVIRYRGLVQDGRGRLVQSCDHAHETLVEAIRCAQRLLNALRSNYRGLLDP
jgi:hypothetical protein